MLDDTRLDTKLAELARELVARPAVPGFTISDAFTLRGIDESGKPGVFAAILLAPQPTPELNTLTTFRQVLSAKLKQLDTTMPAWPIVVQGAPELATSGEAVVPGGREYFEQLRSELQSRLERQAAEVTVEADAAPEASAARPRRGARKSKSATRRVAVARSARTARR